MTDLRIEREVVIEAPMDVVWRTITEPEQITQWFADRAELDARPGGRGTFIFENEGANHVAPLVVEAAEAPKRLAFRWCQPAGEEPLPHNSTLVEFLLSAEGEERTRLRVTESGLDAVLWPEDEKATFAEDHREGWAVHTGRLVALFAGSRAR